MEAEVESRVKQIIEFRNSTSKATNRQVSSSSFHHCSDDQIEEAETVGFSWTVEDIMKGSGSTAESNRFSQNPAAVPLMASCYFSSSDFYSGFCPLRLQSTDIESDFDYHDLLDAQNSLWGQQKVAEGIAAAREESYFTSIELCNAAMSFLPNSVEALICRGASYANISKPEKAINDFERALKIDPSNQNASQYLRKIRDTVMRTTPNTVILPAEAVETRKPEWRVIPSNVKVPSTSWDPITVLAGSSSSSGHNSRDKNSVHITTVNGYAFEREESTSNNSSGSDDVNDNHAKKRKRDHEGKVKKSRKEGKKKKHKHKDRKKESKR